MKAKSPFIAALGLNDQATDGYQAVHLGLSDLSVGSLMDLIKESPGLSPPRSGHLGNWEDVASGQGGALDFNHAICSAGLGHPSIYAFTQTETDGVLPASGDQVYLPGSLVVEGKRTALPLYTWEKGAPGRGFVERSREHAWFCPFVMTQDPSSPGELLPLTRLHWRKMQKVASWSFRLEAQTLVDRAEEVEASVVVLLTEALGRDNAKRALADVISHSVSRSGVMERCALRLDGSGLWLDDCFFPSVEALAASVLLPLRAVTDPEQVLADLAGLPEKMPLLSNLTAALLTANFATHYPKDKFKHQDELNVHFHWGARDMAGYPPGRRGYFFEKSTQRSARWMTEALLRAGRSQPMLFVLLPAPIFLLCATTALRDDADRLDDLFAAVHDAGSAVEPEAAMKVVDALVKDWRRGVGAGLSPYMTQRFTPRQGAVQRSGLPGTGETVFSDGFRRLTLRQACMILSALMGPPCA